MASLFRGGFFVLAAVLCSVSLTVEAARQKPVVRPASATDEFKKGGSTIDINRHWGEVLDVPGGRTTLPVVHSSKYNYARVADLLKRAMNANPAKYAATAAATYLITTLPGASFDPQTGLPIKEPSDLKFSATYWQYQSTNGYTNPTRYFSPDAACRGSVTNLDYTDYEIRNGSCWTRQKLSICPSCSFGLTAYLFSSNISCPSTGVSSSFTCNSVRPSAIPFTDQNYNDLLANVPGIPESAFPDLMRELGNDIPGSFDYPDSETFTGPSSVTGNPVYTTTLDNVTGNTTSSETTPTHNFSYGTNPLTITTTTTNVTNNYQNGVHASTTTTTESSTPSQVQPLPEVPTDCAFMPTVCSFIEWVRSPFGEPEPDLSDLISDDDFEKNFDVSGSVSCPAPSIISTSKGGYEFSWQPACEWAGLLKPFFIIGALLTAVFINLGAIRGN